jgi:membrane protease YdiL (CAAX protease family)
MKKSFYLDAVLYLFITIGVIGVAPIFVFSSYLWILPVLQVVFLIPLLIKKSKLWYSALFFVLLFLFFMLTSRLNFALFASILAFIIYLLGALIFKTLRKEILWLKKGLLNKNIAMLIVGAVVISTTGLLIWAYFSRHTFSFYLTYVPEWRPGFLIIGAVAFAVVNAISEELVFRGIFWDGLEKIWKNPVFVISVQAVFFGLCHYRGFPSGVSGIFLSFGYGMILGFIRHKSKGLLAPVIAHFFADIVIAIVLLKYFNFI